MVVLIFIVAVYWLWTRVISWLHRACDRAEQEELDQAYWADVVSARDNFDRINGESQQEKTNE